MIAHLRRHPSVQQRSRETPSREELVYFNTAMIVRAASI